VECQCIFLAKDNIYNAFNIHYVNYFQEYKHSQKKRYKSCHWGCTFSKGKLLSILGANMYILYANKYILGANKYILGVNVHLRC